MTKNRKQLAKIYYQNREVKNIRILFDDEHHSISIGMSIHISGKKESITMMYHVIEHHDDDKEKVFSECFWQIDDHLDKCTSKPYHGRYND